MRIFKNSCLKNCYKILKFANFVNGGIDIQREIPRAIRKFSPTASLLMVKRSAYSIVRSFQVLEKFDKL